MKKIETSRISPYTGFFGPYLSAVGQALDCRLSVVAAHALASTVVDAIDTYHREWAEKTMSPCNRGEIVEDKIKYKSHSGNLYLVEPTEWGGWIFRYDGKSCLAEEFKRISREK